MKRNYTDFEKQPFTQSLELTYESNKRISKEMYLHSFNTQGAVTETTQLQVSKSDRKTKKYKPIRPKTEEEIDFLEQQFEKDPTWNRKTVQICKKALNLRTDQIYKWGYDKKLRLNKVQNIPKAGISNVPYTKNVNGATRKEENDNRTGKDLNTIVADLLQKLDEEELLMPTNSITDEGFDSKDFCQVKNSDINESRLSQKQGMTSEDKLQ